MIREDIIKSLKPYLGTYQFAIDLIDSITYKDIKDVKDYIREVSTETLRKQYGKEYEININSVLFDGGSIADKLNFTVGYSNDLGKYELVDFTKPF